MNNRQSLSKMAMDQSREVEFSDKVFGTYHPETINRRREMLELAIASLIYSDSPDGFAIGFTQTFIRHAIEDGLEHLLDTVKGSNHPMIKKIREEI